MHGMDLCLWDEYGVYPGNKVGRFNIQLKMAPDDLHRLGLSFILVNKVHQKLKM